MAGNSPEDEPDEEYVQLRMAFPLLKRVCDPIAICPDDKSNAERLRCIIKEIKTPVLQKFSDYLFVPVFLHLSNKDNLKSNTACSVLDCLKVILEYVPVEDENQFWKLCIMTFQLIHKDNDDDYAVKLPEELKMLTVECLTLLFKNTTPEVLQKIYTPLLHRRLSVVVFHAVLLAKREKFVQLRVAALRLIRVVLQLDRDLDEELKKRTAEIAGLMMPGIISCAVSVATSSDTLNHKVVVEAVRLWGRLIGLVMTDRESKSTSSSRTYRLGVDTDLPLPLTGTGKSNEKSSVCSDDWLEQSGLHLVAVTEKMLSLVQHGHWKVRNQLVTEMGFILTVAPNNMRRSVNRMLDGLLCLSQDENEDVAIAAKRVIKLFANDCDRDHRRGKLIEIIEESFYSAITRLPRILHGFDLSQKEKQLSILAGYIDVMGSRHLPGLLNSSQHLTRLLKCLYTAAYLDCTAVLLLEEQAVREFEEEVGPGRPKDWMNLKHSGSPRYSAILQKIARQLLLNSDGPGGSTVVYALCDDFDSKPIYRKEIVYLLIMMFKPSSDNQFREAHREYADHVLKALLEHNIWDVSVKISSLEDKNDVRSNIVQLCLLSELVALLAASIGAESFAPHLLTCLYPLLECAGSPLYSLSIAGLSAIQSLARLFGGDVGHLVAGNVDYLSYHVTLNLRHAYRNPKVLSVLTVIMKHSTFQVFPSLYEIVKDVLVQSCDTFQDVNATAFLHVFLTFISRLLDWQIEVNSAETTNVSTAGPSSFWEQFIDFYKTYLIAHNDCDMPMDEADIGEYSHPMEESGDDKPPVPDHIIFTVDILHRSLHFLPSKETARQILVLQILEKGILVLNQFTDQLLPMVHKIWSPLVQRFGASSDPLVLRRSFSLLQTLASTSKDFIRPRTCKEVIPFLCKYLRRQIEEAKTEKDQNSYKMTQKFKLVHALLDGLGELAVSLDVADDELEVIVEALAPYLSNRVSSQFQDAASNSIVRISKKDAHVVWTHLMSISPNVNEFAAPSTNLFSLKVKSSLEDPTEYVTQVHEILNKLDSYR